MNVDLSTKDSFNFEFNTNGLDLILMKGFGNYTWLYFADGSKKLSSKTMHSLYNLIPNDALIRTHKSYTVNSNYCKRITDINNTCVEMTNGLKAEISRRKRKIVLDLLANRNPK